MIYDGRETCKSGGVVVCSLLATTNHENEVENQNGMFTSGLESHSPWTTKSLRARRTASAKLNVRAGHHCPRISDHGHLCEAMLQIQAPGRVVFFHAEAQVCNAMIRRELSQGM